MKVVVLGAGIAGLGSALALGRAGHEVTLLERDDIGRAVDAEDAFAARGRRGAPQTRHSHAFLARTRALLEWEAPDVLAALYAAGVSELRFTDSLPPEMEGFVPEPADEELAALASRRTTFEWVLRERAVAGGAVELVHDLAAGLECDLPGRSSGLPRAGAGPAVPRVTGVRLASGRRLRADVVVDATGRRSPLVSWLEDLGSIPPEVTNADTGIVYSTRFYRLADGAERPPADGPIGGDLGYMKYAVFPADNRTFSITFAVPTSDADLRVLLHEGPFDRAADAMPGTAAWVEPGRSSPMTGVEVMARLVNRKVDLVVGGRPVVTGVFAVGDSQVCTNPLYGRGCSLALVHAYLLEGVLAEHDPSGREAAVAFHEATLAHLVPWYVAAVAQDAESVPAFGAGDGSVGMGSLVRDGLLPAARRDPRVLRAFLRVLNLLDAPTAPMSDPYVLGKVLESFKERESRPPLVMGPRRGELLTAIA
jgi:2-polyprenyl-6-methoxyphenol hydroxylase-like FAD-dependent oxidoreductase